MKTLTHPRNWILLATTAAVLSACGGGGGSDTPAGTITPTQPTSLNQVVQGTVTGFGSVFVEGVRYDDSAAKVRIEENDASPREDSLSAVKLGMRVELLSDDKGKASQVKVSPETIGKITVVSVPTDSFTIAGQTVRITTTASATAPATVFEGVANLAGLAVNDFVEVHGPRDSAGVVLATRVERKTPLSAMVVRVAGVVDSYNATNNTFKIGGLTVQINGTTNVTPSGQSVSNGTRVAVWSDQEIVGGTVIAKSVSIRRSGLTNNDAAKIGGLISSANLTTKTFKIDGVDVDFSGVTLSADDLSNLSNGRRVRVVGTFANNKVTATEVKLLKSSDDFNKAELIGVVSDFVSTSNFKVRGASVDATKPGVQFSGGTIDNLANGVLVKIEGKVEGNVINPTKFEFVAANADDRPRSLLGEISLRRENGFRMGENDIEFESELSIRGNDNSAASRDDLINARKVEVRGSFRDGKFRVSEVIVQKAAGVISSAEGVASEVSINGFKLNGTPVQLNAQTQFEPAGVTLAEGAKVEVYGAITNGVIVASKVEIKLPETAGIARVKGTVTDFVSASNFRVNGQKVKLGANPVISGSGTLRNGSLIEVKGPMSDGVLTATELEYKK